MRILYAHNDYGSWSGEETAAEALVALLNAHGHEVIWFRRSSRELNGSLVGKVKAFFAGIHNPSSARDITRVLDEVKPDLVQVQNIYPLLSPSIFGPIRKRNIPIVMRCPNYRLFCPNGIHWVRGQVCEKCLDFGRELWCVLKNCEDNIFKSTGYALRNAWTRLSRSILANVDMFIVQTEFQKQRFVEAGIPEQRIGIVPGFLQYDGIAESQEEGTLVTFVGRVSPEKGIEDFLDAAQRLPDIPFAIAGKEDGMRGIRQRSPANVQWLGYLQSDALQGLYMHSRMIVIPGRWFEGFPNVAVQAMTYARPVVAARIGAMTCIVDDKKTGLLYTAGDATDLSDKLSILYQDRELSRVLGQAARRKALAEYSPERIYSVLMAVYEKALQRHRK